LQGDLGSGKSTLARAFIRAVADDDALEVPSPTFAVMQPYDLRVPLLHVDLYRLRDAHEIHELGLTELAAEQALLIEWPERIDLSAFSRDVLLVTLAGHGERRDITLQASGHASGGWASALARDGLLADFLKSTGFGGDERRFFLGDASSRRYETLHGPGERKLLMDMPGRPDGVPIRHGKHYSALARLADRIDSVVAINAHLRGLGYSAPETYACDLTHGFAVMEFLEGEVHGAMMRRGDDMTEPMQCATAVLADMARQSWPRRVSSAHGQFYDVADFDLDAMLIEVDLMPSWFWPHQFGTEAPQDIHDSFEEVWRHLLPLTFEAPRLWMLRDFHSPNLIWMPQRQGLQRTGLIDTQDAVMGHGAYDLASLLQDARCDVTPEFQDMLLRHYVNLRRAQGGFDEKTFRRDYAVLAAQRASRLLGTFTRLSVRDGKHQYLAHRPRVAGYLMQSLEHPALKPLRDWYQTHAPQVFALATS
jgi:N-acetylmuramate 1-kinase